MPILLVFSDAAKSSTLCNICKWQTCVSFHFYEMEQKKTRKKITEDDTNKNMNGFVPICNENVSEYKYEHSHLCIDEKES